MTSKSNASESAQLRESLAVVTEQWRSSNVATLVDVLCVEGTAHQAATRIELQTVTAPELRPSFAGTLADAERMIGVRVFDVMLVDLDLPDCGGIDTLLRLRAVAPYLPAIVIAGGDDVAIAGEAWLCGVQDFILRRELNALRLAKAIVGAIARHRLSVECLAARDSQRFEALGMLCGGVAHDFNNILLAITANACEAAEELQQDHPARANIDEIRRSSQRAIDLVRRIVGFGRPSKRHFGYVDLAPVVAEALQLVRAALPATIDIRSHYASDPSGVLGDASEIHQIVVNLAINAGQAIGRRRGVIDVVLDYFIADAGAIADGGQTGQAYVRLRVTDDGVGMDEATRIQIFDPYFTTRAAAGGTGLGLSLVMGTVRALGGYMRVCSAPGAGATFTLCLPAAPAVIARNLATTVNVASPRGHGERIAYVDDDAALRFVVPRILGRSGYVVTAFNDPRQVVEAVRVRRAAFDIVLTDIAMPEMSGFELVGALRALRPDLPILMMSGRVSAEDERLAGQMGVQQIIPKQESLQRMHAALSLALADAAFRGDAEF